MEQTKALNALAPFLALTKSATSPRAAATLIIQATSAPNTFVFNELLAAPQIQALSSSEEFSNHLTLLKIFSYGTYTDYTSNTSLPALVPTQSQKLRQLSFLTLARKPASLTYSKLLQSLGLETQRELEDLVISAIYAGLVDGTLDPYNQRVNISSVAPLRDIEPNSIPAMLSTLNEWSARCTTTLADLEKQIASIKATAQRRHKEEVEWAAQVEKLVEGKGGDSKKEEEKSSGGGLFSSVGRKLGMGAASKRGSAGLDGDDDDDDMELDEDEDDIGDRRGLRSSKKRGFANLGGHAK